MTTYIRTKVGGDSVIEVNGVEAVVIGSGGITSGIAPGVITAAMQANDAKPLGVGQTWQAVTRTSGVTYTNSTGRSIVWSQQHTGVAGGSSVTVINGLQVASHVLPNGTFNTSFIIPPGSTYSATVTGTQAWISFELR
jgi:hypothetical protein